MDTVDIAISRLAEQDLGSRCFSFVRMCSRIIEREIRFRFNNFANQHLAVNRSHDIGAKQVVRDVLGGLSKELPTEHVLMAYLYGHVFNLVHGTQGCPYRERIRLSRPHVSAKHLYYLQQHDPTTCSVGRAA